MISNTNNRVLIIEKKTVDLKCVERKEVNKIKT